MGQRHTLAGKLASLAALAAFALPQAVRAQTVDDFFLLSTSVAPNVVLLFDNSDAMNQIEWHPSYDQTQTPSCANWSNTTTYTFTKDSKNVTACGHTRDIYGPNNPT